VFGILFLALAVRSEHLVTGARGQAGPGWPRVLAWLLWGQLAALACAVFAGAFGYMRLARLLGAEVLASSYVALVLYAGVRVGEGLVAYVLRARPLGLLFTVQQHRELLQDRVNRALRWISVGAWVYFTLDGLGVMSTSLAAVDTVLSARYVRGSVSLSLGDVVAFGLTIWAAFLLSSFIRFVLHEDVYPRVGLPRGLPYALSSLLHYTVVLVARHDLRQPCRRARHCPRHHRDADRGNRSPCRENPSRDRTRGGDFGSSCRDLLPRSRPIDSIR
jgi:small-conductance mechanosensitive channel